MKLRSRSVHLTTPRPGIQYDTPGCCSGSSCHEMASFNGLLEILQLSVFDQRHVVDSSLRSFCLVPSVDCSCRKHVIYTHTTRPTMLSKCRSVIKEIYHNPDGPYQGGQQTPQMSAVSMYREVGFQPELQRDLNHASHFSSLGACKHAGEVFSTLGGPSALPELSMNSNRTRCPFIMSHLPLPKSVPQAC